MLEYRSCSGDGGVKCYNIIMLENYITFYLLIFVQFFLFVLYGLYTKKRFKELLNILIIGCCVGIFFGPIFDYSIGFYAGVYDYSLGFDIVFLLQNGLLSFGIMIAHVGLLDKLDLKTFYITVVILGLLYEITNFLLPIWTWTFDGITAYQYALVIIFAYFGLSLLMAGVLHIMKIRLFNNLFLFNK
jgi:LytS/YehU family sensor histidine kinase